MLRTCTRTRAVVLGLIGLLLITALGAGCAGGGPAAEPGPSGSQGSSPPAAGGTIAIGIPYTTPSLDNLSSGTTHFAQRLILDTLVTRDPEGNYHPGVAESWTTGDDGLTWTFKLRPGIKFHDGTPCDAAAVKWFFDKCRDPEGTYAFSTSFSAVEDITAPDDGTVVFHLGDPCPNLLFSVSETFSGIISPTAYEKFGEDYGSAHCVGSGPYRLKEWIPQEKLIVVRNEDYDWAPPWCANQGVPYLDEIVFKYFPENSTRVMELETGGLDILYAVPKADYERLTSREDLSFRQKPRYGGCLVYLDFNHERPPFDELAVRQAINWSIDREAILKTVYGGMGQVAHGYMPLTWEGSCQEASEAGYGYDPDRARQLLAEAGFEDGDGIVERGGGPFTTTLYVQPGSDWKQAGEIVQEQLRMIGIDAEIQVMEYSAMVDKFKAGENELALLLWGYPDPDVLHFFFPSSQIPYPNSTRLDDATVDGHLEAAATASSWEKRVEALEACDRYLVDSAVWAPIVFLDDNIAVNGRVKGYGPHPFGDDWFNDVYVRTTE